MGRERGGRGTNVGVGVVGGGEKREKWARQHLHELFRVRWYSGPEHLRYTSGIYSLLTGSNLQTGDLIRARNT